MAVRIEWHGDEYLNNLKKTTGDNLEKAAIHLKDKIKNNINRSQETRGTGHLKRGNDPSAEGDFPKKVVGFLQRSIAHEMASDRSTGYVGTGLEIGRYLELGTSKMAARPYLRSTLDFEAATLAKIISQGSK